MRILWYSNAPWVSSGYGVQTRLFVPRLQALGHEVAVFCNYGLEGGVLQWGPVRCFPRRFHAHGLDILPAHAREWKADIVLTLYDTWVMDTSVFPEAIRWVPWLPVDHEPCPPAVTRKIREAFAPIAYSRYGERAVTEQGIPCAYVPHGYDASEFHPEDPCFARQQLKWPADRYVVGLVAANNGYPSRKAFAEHFKAFAEFRRHRSDALLYVHTHLAPQGEAGGVNVAEMAEMFGIGDCVLFADQYNYAVGYDADTMRHVYNALDVLMSVTMGEGFGVPVLEAQACGTPVIVGEWTASGELCFAGEKVLRSEAHPFFTALAAYQFLPDVEAITDRLLRVAEWTPVERSEGRAAAIRGAAEYEADRVTADYWRPVLDEIAARIPGATPSGTPPVVPSPPVNGVPVPAEIVLLIEKAFVAPAREEKPEEGESAQARLPAPEAKPAPVASSGGIPPWLIDPGEHRNGGNTGIKLRPISPEALGKETP